MYDFDDANGDYDGLKNRLNYIEKENKMLREQLAYQTMKHKQWKSLAMTFHDSLWKIIDKYMMIDKSAITK